MTDPVSPPAEAPPPAPGLWPRWRARLFATPVNAVLTILFVWLLLMVLPPLVQWALIDANFTATNAAQCSASAGACWAFIGVKYRLILFGLYPYSQQWRPLVAALILVAMIVASAMPRCWGKRLVVVWVLGLVAVGVLMWGGVAGLEPVPDSSWGGLPLTLILASAGIALAFPLGVVLALGRRSDMPAIKSLCVIYIELIRGVPMISLLFMASVMLPLFLPLGWSIDKLLRALVAIVLFTAAYIAETVRGGLQAVPSGQYQAAQALGLSYWQTMFSIVLPQALKIVIGPLVSIFISLFKDTSLVVIIGIFDLTQSAKAALADAAWAGFSIEAYVFIAAIYFIFCWSMSRYSRALEMRLDVRKERA